MNSLAVKFTKGRDGTVLLQCVRGDGSATWQKQTATNARFFVLHDLTHFAVESVLQIQNGFYGLIAAGWEIADTTGRSSKGALPDETIAVEHLVGMLDIDRANGAGATAAEMVEHWRRYAAQNGLKADLDLTEQTLQQIRNYFADLHARWITLAAATTLTLEFPTK